MQPMYQQMPPMRRRNMQPVMHPPIMQPKKKLINTGAIVGSGVGRWLGGNTKSALVGGVIGKLAHDALGESEMNETFDPLELVQEHSANEVLDLLLQEENWIQKAAAHMKKGLLHKKLGVPKGETIPKDKLDAAYAKAKKDGDTKTMQEITFAKNAGNFGKKE